MLKKADKNVIQTQSDLQGLIIKALKHQIRGSYDLNIVQAINTAERTKEKLDQWLRLNR